MAAYADSKIVNWLEGHPWTSIEPCQGHEIDTLDFAQADCAQVCNESRLLFDGRSQNLVNCAFWATIADTLTDSPASFADKPQIPSDEAMQYLEQYEATGLDSRVFKYASSFLDIVGNCFMVIYLDRFQNTYLDDGSVHESCTRTGLFPGSNVQGDVASLATYTGKTLQSCLDALCAPVPLNPDLAGIGVFVAFIMQSAILLFAGTHLLFLEFMPRMSESFRRLHTEALITSLVSFHKAQCYFSSTIQIAALILSSGILSGLTPGSAKGGTDLVDLAVINMLAISGFLPITVGVICITRYSHLSWYIVILSFVAFLLAAATFIFALLILIRANSKSTGDVVTMTEGVIDYPTGSRCLKDVDFTDILRSMCGYEILRANSLSSQSLDSPWIILLFVNCAIWFILCLSTRISKPYRITNRLLKRLVRSLARYHVKILLFLVTFGLCFSGQFVLFGIYARHALISPRWSFGQIIAVTIWAPSLIEYIYIEYSKYMNLPPSSTCERGSDRRRWHRRSFKAHVSFAIESDG